MSVSPIRLEHIFPSFCIYSCSQGLAHSRKLKNKAKWKTKIDLSHWVQIPRLLRLLAKRTSPSLNTQRTDGGKERQTELSEGHWDQVLKHVIASVFISKITNSLGLKKSLPVHMNPRLYTEMNQYFIIHYTGMQEGTYRSWNKSTPNSNAWLAPPLHCIIKPSKLLT